MACVLEPADTGANPAFKETDTLISCSPSAVAAMYNHDEKKTDELVGGWLCDLLIRLEEQLGKMKAKRRDEGTLDHIKALKGNVEPAKMLPGYDHARDMVLGEILTSRLMDSVTKDLKQRWPAKGGWAPSRTADLWSRMRSVVMLKREVGIFHSEVEFRTMMSKLKHTKARPVLESPQERRDRVESFWMEFHDRSREPGKRLRINPGARSTPARQLDLVDHCGGFGDNWRLSRSGPNKNSRPASQSGRQKLASGKSPSGLSSRGGSSEIGMAVSPSSGKTLTNSRSLPSLPQRSGVDKAVSTTPTRAGLSRQNSDMSPKQQSTFLPPIDAVPASRSLYLQECDSNGVIPKPCPFVTGHSESLNAGGRDLVDSDMQAITALLPDRVGVEYVNLQDNALLTDKSLAPFLRRLKKERPQSLRRLNLSGCAKIALSTLNECVQLLQVSSNLVQLRISRVHIGTRFQLPLCAAIGSHTSLKDVSIAETGLGSSVLSKQCMTHLLDSGTVHTLDLGWNCFDADVFGHLGRCMEGNVVTKTLCVSNCSAAIGAEAIGAPVSFFIEQLVGNRSLQTLDVSLNRFDYRTALVLEDSLAGHAGITRLVLTENPLGVLGMRSIVRLLSRNSSGLREIDTEGCFNSTAEVGNDACFSATIPGGLYTLDLERPYHRSVLRMLYKSSERFKLPPDQSFEIVNFTTPPFSHASKTSDGVWQVPRSGTLTLKFSVERGIESSLTGVDDHDFRGFFAAYSNITRYQPAYHKVIPILTTWRQLEGKTLELRCFVNALGKDFNISTSLLHHMAQSDPGFACEAITNLVSCIPATTWAQYMIVLLFRRLTDVIVARKTMTVLLDFNMDNPTGHYKLDLSRSVDSGVAEQLLVIDCWESAIDRRLGRVDVSQRGNRSHLRNEAYQGQSLKLRYASIAEWTLPEHGSFEFDYVTGKRPVLAREAILTDECFESILASVNDSEASACGKIASMRSISHHFLITSMQTRTLLGNFATEEQRCEVLSIFILRNADIHNAKLFRVRFEQFEEVQRLSERLGFATCFPFIQPENTRFHLNLAENDQRICASIIVRLANLEKPGNIKQAAYLRANGSIDPLPLGVPRSWESPEKMPAEGHFKCLYVSAPEDRKYDARKKMAITYNFFDVNAAEKDVMWWTGLAEPPEDVLSFLEFIIGAGYKNADDVFEVIDGVGGNGEISRREFEEGLETMKCYKFKGKDGLERMHSVFRYLDPGGEGSVSREEWGIMHQLWAEFELSVKEFVAFLVRKLGDDLAVVWAFLDEDGSGELDENEWLDSVRKLGYFGPAKVVFSLLDNSGDGNISLDEFWVLEKYLPSKSGN
eukprot:TRINITY_DN2636_c1_g1_i1.p1 TRINITY_DN2636_c1_g1~~TRINITY_DN2636_c1_g1_i1.p1  ORF type:complete len:1333 (-),score=203.37 TRINITY_DN2636_c1_g1_i1:459-4457(-)